MTSPSKVWFVTGGSAGIGLSLTRYALAQGHRVIATSRSPHKTPELVEEFERKGGKMVALDTTASAAEIRKAMHEAEAIFGPIDVLVNNAGYCVLAAFEDTPDADAARQMDVNFMGPLRIMQAVLPGMRKRRSGVIVNVSSAQGPCPGPTSSVYAASKAALEAVSDAIAQEVEPFGVRVVIVQPGAFQTKFAAATNATVIEPSEEYADEAHPVGKRFVWLRKLGGGGARGSCEKAAKVMYEAATGQGETGRLLTEQKLLRLVIGPDSWAVINTKVDELRRTVDLEKDVAASTDA